MTHEDYVSFEQAKALKELGFDWETLSCYLHVYEGEHGWRFRMLERLKSRNDPKDYTCLAAPTLAQAQKWLREIKGIDITIDHVYHRLDTGDKVMYGLHIGNQSTFKTEFYLNYDSYEEALSAGIDKALELLKSENNGK